MITESKSAAADLKLKEKSEKLKVKRTWVSAKHI
jgi:hypothetical protein